MCRGPATGVVLRVWLSAALLLAAARARGPPHPPAQDPCALLHHKYAEPQREKEKLYAQNGTGDWRRVHVRGAPPVPLQVWAGAREAGAPAAAALLLAALRHALSFDASLNLDPPPGCPNISQYLPVAAAADAAALRASCGALGELAAGRAAALPALRALATHAAADCPRALRVGEQLRACRFLASDDLKLDSHCKVTATAEKGRPPAVLYAAEQEAAARLVLAAFSPQRSLQLVRFPNISCFNNTIQHLKTSTNTSFLYIIYPNNDQETDSCLATIGKISDQPIRVGDGFLVQRYAPRVAEVVEQFCPQLEHLTEIFDNVSRGVDIHKAACTWALDNSVKFESWIQVKKKKYRMYIFLCDGDPHEDYYTDHAKQKMSDMPKAVEIEVIKKLVYCHNHTNLYNNFLDILGRKGFSIIGAIAWSSMEGISEFVELAELNHIPVVLAGPVPTKMPLGPYTTAVSGRLNDLAQAYRRILKHCGWSRLAILSDGSSYAKFFATTLLEGYDVISQEKLITSENIINVLYDFQKKHARVFFLNTNASLACKIVRAAERVRLSPEEGYAWVAREWGPGPREACGGLRVLALRPARTHLERPAGAEQLADAMLLLVHGFAKYYDIYSSNSYMSEGTINFSQIFKKINVTGMSNTSLVPIDGVIETTLVLVEQWRGANRTVLAAWHRGHEASEEPNTALCGARVRDRPHCVLVGGPPSFLRPCYDISLYTLIVTIVLFPVVYVFTKPIRLRRMAVRDEKIIASLFKDKYPSIIHRNLLQLNKEIGEGHFGCVYLATLQRPGNRSIYVAAKVLRDKADKEEYLHEVLTLNSLDHKNVIKFVGVCIANGSMYILMEHAYYGDLLRYLRDRRHLVGGAQTEAEHVSAGALTRLGREAAAALAHLARERLVHRDVRAANCLVDERRSLKLADFGMARKLSHDEEYTTIRRALFPVVWMAPESINSGVFSPASDVWALGLLLLELTTLGQRPYGTLTPPQVVSFVQRGGSPPLPVDISPQTQELVQACWRREADARPSAEELAARLAREPRALRPALLPAPLPALSPIPLPPYNPLI